MIALTITEDGLVQTIERLEGVERLSGPERQELADGIGRLAQEQHRRRITVEKTTPAGEPWQENLTGTSILYASGALARSIDYRADADEIEVGSGLPYAGIQHTGGTIRAKGRALRFQLGNRLVFARHVTLPAREWLGLSADNEAEIIGEAESFLAELLQ